MDRFIKKTNNAFIFALAGAAIAHFFGWEVVILADLAFITFAGIRWLVINKPWKSDKPWPVDQDTLDSVMYFEE